MWQAWRLSKAYHKTPAELYGIEHPVQAFFFNRAVFLFGTTLEADLEKVASKAKKPKQAEQAQMRMLQKWLGSEVIGFAQPTTPPRPTTA